jgi:hypothetical protein
MDLVWVLVDLRQPNQLLHGNGKPTVLAYLILLAQ